jgi:hypothetical protein
MKTTNQIHAAGAIFGRQRNLNGNFRLIISITHEPVQVRGDASVSRVEASPLRVSTHLLFRRPYNVSPLFRLILWRAPTKSSARGPKRADGNGFLGVENNRQHDAALLQLPIIS